MKIDPQGVLATFRGKAADEMARLREENETLVAERDRLRVQLEAAQTERDEEEASANGWTDIVLGLVIKIHASGHWSPGADQTLADQIQDAVQVLIDKSTVADWIDFRERRPEDGQLPVLWCHRWKHEVPARWRYYIGGDAGYNLANIDVFWQPLPAPPSGEMLERAKRCSTSISSKP